jgi:hypothetical protein
LLQPGFVGGSVPECVKVDSQKSDGSGLTGTRFRCGSMPESLGPPLAHGGKPRPR